MSVTDKIILIDKPLDWSSANVLNVLKKHLDIKKIGHAGTLDPRATGLLVACTGKFTKKINDFINFDKEYTGIFRIGAVTESFDTEKPEINLIDSSHITDEMVISAGKKFTGKIFQMPPMHSAVKHKGKPLYLLARKGKEIERKEREIIIESFTVKKLNSEEVFFNISCSKGTYIRTLADDFGKELGVGAYLKTLRRTRVGKFKLSDFENEINGIKYTFYE